MKYGICPVCNKEGKLTVHHALPKRFFKGEGEKVKVCWSCHCEIEQEIPQDIQMPVTFYYQILSKFGV